MPSRTPDAAHVHTWVDKALPNEPPLKVCACGATLTGTEYRNAEPSAFFEKVEEIVELTGRDPDEAYCG